MKAFGFTLLLLITSVQAGAALIVIADFGGQSAMPYYEEISLQGEGNKEDEEHLSSVIAPIKSAQESDFLPVNSTSITPGKVKARTISLPGMQPLFLIGDDPLSRRWLQTQRERLGSLDAVGLVVNISNQARLAALRALAPHLTLLPLSADDLAKRLALTHYPLLLTATAVEQ